MQEAAAQRGETRPANGKTRHERIAELMANVPITEEDAADFVDEAEAAENECEERMRRARERGRPALDSRGNERDPLDTVRWALNRPPLPLRRILQYGDDQQAHFAFELDDGTVVPLGPSADLLSPRKVRAALLVRGLTIAFFAEKRWNDEIVCHFPTLTVEIATGGSEALDTEEWLERFTHERVYEQDPGQPLGAVIVAAKRSSGVLRLDDGRLYVRVSKFGTFVRRAIGHSDIRDHELRHRLVRGLGFSPAGRDGRIQARHEGKPVEMRCLVSPPGWKRVGA